MFGMCLEPTPPFPVLIAFVVCGQQADDGQITPDGLVLCTRHYRRWERDNPSLVQAAAAVSTAIASATGGVESPAEAPQPEAVASTPVREAAVEPKADDQPPATVADGVVSASAAARGRAIVDDAFADAKARAAETQARWEREIAAQRSQSKVRRRDLLPCLADWIGSGVLGFSFSFHFFLLLLLLGRR